MSGRSHCDTCTWRIESLKKLNDASQWKCVHCGFSADGWIWNKKWLKDVGLWGAVYRCPDCKKETRVKRNRANLFSGAFGAAKKSKR